MPNHDPFDVCETVRGSIENGEIAPAPGDYVSKCTSKVVASPITMVEIFVSVLRQYFGSTDRLRLDRGSFMWNPDPAKSEIFITSGHPKDHLNNETDGVGFAVEHQDLESKEIKSVLGGNMNNALQYDQVTGEVIYGSFTESMIYIWVVGREYNEALALGYEALTLFKTFAPVIKRTYELDALSVVKMTSPKKTQEKVPKYAGAVIVPYSVLDAWAVKPENLPVKTLDIKLTI